MNCTLTAQGTGRQSIYFLCHVQQANKHSSFVETFQSWLPLALLVSQTIKTLYSKSVKLFYKRWNSQMHQWRVSLVLTLAMPEMMMVLFFTGDLSFCLADWWSCLMAASATGSVPLSISSSVSDEDRALLTVVPSMDACSETRRSDSLGLLATGSEGAQSYLNPLLHEHNGSSKFLLIINYESNKNKRYNIIN